MGGSADAPTEAVEGDEDDSINLHFHIDPKTGSVAKGKGKDYQIYQNIYHPEHPGWLDWAGYPDYPEHPGWLDWPGYPDLPDYTRRPMMRPRPGRGKTLGLRCFAN